MEHTSSIDEDREKIQQEEARTRVKDEALVEEQGPKNNGNPESPMVVSVDTSNSFATNKIFTDQDSVFDWCKSVGKGIGVVVVTMISERKESGRKPRLILGCERSGPYRPRVKKVEEEKGVGTIVSSKPPRKTNTKKCDCPFRLKGVIDSDDKWTVTVVSGVHNHLLGDNLIGHSYAGRFSKEEKKLVTDLTIAGAKPREMMNVVKNRFPENQSTKSTLYNFRAKYKLKSLEGRSQMQQFLKLLDENDYVEFHRENAVTGECMDIFFAHPESIKMAKCFPEVIIMDCTYKTIRQRLPLLEIVGFTSTEKTFSIAFVYLTDEKIDNYQWALQMLHHVLESKVSDVNVIMTDCELAAIHAISQVFPASTHLLCRWHVERNIEGNYKKTFDTVDEWNTFIDMFKDMMHSSKVVDYEKKLNRLKEAYSGHVNLIPYIEKQWLSKYKEKFISAWTNSIMHFATHTTNRAESMHASLKRHLGSAVNSLEQNWRFIDDLLQSQITEITSSFNKSKNTWGVQFRDKPWMQVRGAISHSAMDMLAKQLRKSKFVGVDQEKCGCVVKTTCGIPCAHELSYIVTFLNKSIPLSSIHERWRKLDSVPVELRRGALDIEPEIAAIRVKFDTLSDHQKVMMINKLREIAEPQTTLLQEPRVKENVRGRPAKSKGRAGKGDTSTKREPSAFEISQTKEEREENGKRKRSVHKMKPRRGKKKTEAAAIVIDTEYECKWEDDLWELNPIFRDFFTSWEPVPRDGHCGFRSVAKLLGLEDSDGWVLVRARLLDELNAHYQDYSDIFDVPMMTYLTKNLQCREPVTMNRGDWFTFPEMGLLVACAFDCVFAHIQPGPVSTSYFPLRRGPHPEPSMNHILAVAHIENHTHFIPVQLKDGAPLPPCAKIWENNAWPDAKEWKTLCQSKLDLWEKELPRNFSKLVVECLI